MNEPSRNTQQHRSVGSADYVERLTAPWWGWLLIAMLAGATGIALGAPLGQAWGIGSGVVVFVLTAVVTHRSTAVIEIRDGQIFAGRAHIDVRYISRAEELDQEQTRHLRGPGADSRAWMLIRGWITTAVRLNINDPDDPTPYWFVSTRRPQALIASLQQAALRRWSDAS